MVSAQTWHSKVKREKHKRVVLYTATVAFSNNFSIIALYNLQEK